MENGGTVEQWIWLQRVFGAGSPKPAKLVEAMGSAGAAYRAARGDYAALRFLTERELTCLCDKSLAAAETVVDECMKRGYSVLTPADMPERLRAIEAPPCVLYVWGGLPEPKDGFYVAMVGTRRVTPYGVEAATRLAEGLAAFDAVVVSGMAVGVDAASHKGALKGGGKTVAVIGCGIDVDYPLPHRELKRLIAASGAVVSEYPPGSRPDRSHFPIRNRLIAGLSLGTVVVEAGARSGALITATLAAEMGRDVFAVPGSIFSPVSEGSNRLLRDGAKPVCGVLDILEEYPGFCPQNLTAEWAPPQEPEQMTLEALTAPAENARPGNPGGGSAPSPAAQPAPAPLRQAKAPAGLSETQLAVYRQLSASPRHVDDIALGANLELRRVLAVLTTLEIQGLARSLPGRRYTLFG